MKELIAKIKRFEEKSGLKLYDEIMGDLGKIHQKLERSKKQEEHWKEKYFEEKKKTK